MAEIKTFDAHICFLGRKVIKPGLQNIEFDTEKINARAAEYVMITKNNGQKTMFMLMKKRA